jgi:hypothetical protein
VLPSCMKLASRIVAAGENVVANNARCTDLVQQVAFIERLLQQLQVSMARCDRFPAVELLWRGLQAAMYASYVLIKF